MKTDENRSRKNHQPPPDALFLRLEHLADALGVGRHPLRSAAVFAGIDRVPCIRAGLNNKALWRNADGIIQWLEYLWMRPVTDAERVAIYDASTPFHELQQKA